MSTHRIAATALAAALLPVLPASHASAEPAVEIVALGLLPDGRGSTAADINNAGVVVGTAWPAEGWGHAVRWGQDGTMIDLGTAGGIGASAGQINDRGEILGERYLYPGGPSHVVRWDARAVLTVFETLPGGPSNWFVGMTERGVVGGTSYSPTSYGGMVSHAVRWDPVGRITDLGSGDRQSMATGMNSTGTIVGLSDTEYGSHGVRWDSRGVMTVLDRLPGSTSSYAREINDAGVVAGFAVNANGVTRAVRWDRQGRITDLGTFPGGDTSNGYGLGEDGTVLGYANGAGGPAALWDQRGRITDLGGLPGGEFLAATDMNRRKVIIGGGASIRVWWDRRGRIHQLFGLNGDTDPSISLLTDKNIMVGASENQATLWRLPG